VFVSQAAPEPGTTKKRDEEVCAGRMEIRGDEAYTEGSPV